MLIIEKTIIIANQASALDIVAWFVYLLSAVLFVMGLHFMNSPKTARKGNFVSATGMVIAVLMAFVKMALEGVMNGIAVVVLIVGIIIGALAGVISAKKVKMTDMPQLVSVFNTVGGGAAALVALNDILAGEEPNIVVLITAGLGVMIGSVTFTGSLIAAGKLQGIKWVRKLALPGKSFWNALFIVLTIASFVLLCVFPGQRVLWSILTAVFALCYGLVFVIPIGGADMPVVISVLNACTGTAVAMSGLAIDNVALIVAGALVGAAGVTLSVLMSKAMNRPLMSVLAGGFGGGSGSSGAGDDGVEGTMKETSADDLAVQLVYADKVIFVPGFGLAQAQAQRELADLGELLKEHGVEVEYAIHPVAGRMPGHMNVLLAEANVPYEELVDLEDINPQFPSANVSLVVGANDVTNPAARRPGTPVSGMPILDVDKSQNVVVMKRGRGKGYAGIENELYFENNTQMLFGDAKASLQAVIAAVKELLQ
ncbi:NAD(P)(+) transhydrogenase (Re/Si-specific) subunit beta [Bifidobacterium choloepi]|uniref:NAD(P) transhydrogenase subunit beta n=1 Tax=Bifidobacterium choloepi TaxID=2614131 RepID=A0A6I5NCN6_9BIFI|nr:NAD(P)(+) transhydrogenase (Re/Si-specific) subunit beta [Bifidobacterium choloepi]NEG69234.1 NAD(P)(+) transhydrogenase (Re/Si-specific) subunit beta [Bifidobacterium choloepi]